MAKLFFIFWISLSTFKSFALEKCNFGLDKSFFKISFSFYVDDERKEIKGFFKDQIIQGSLFGNSVRNITKDLKVFIPYSSITSFNTTRDRLIYNALIDGDRNKENQIKVRVISLEKEFITLELQLNKVTKKVKFKFDSQDTSMQSIGYIDIQDFGLEELKRTLENKYKLKFWNDIFIDIKAQFSKNCSTDL